MSAEEQAAHFNKEAESYDSKFGEINTACASAHVSQITSRLLSTSSTSSSLRVLDLGAGTGNTTIPIASLPNVSQVVALDVSEGMLAQLSKKLPTSLQSKVMTVCGNLLSDDESTCAALKQKLGGPFDVVVTSVVLHHIVDVSKAVKVLAGLLKPGSGMLSVVDLERASEITDEEASHAFFGGNQQSMTAAHQHLVHHHGFTRKTFEEYLRNAGLIDIQTQTAGKIARPPQDHHHHQHQHPDDSAEKHHHEAEEEHEHHHHDHGTTPTEVTLFISTAIRPL